MIKFLEGKKTYILATVSLVWAVYGWTQGLIDALEAQKVVWFSLTIMAGRAAIK